MKRKYYLKDEEKKLILDLYDGTTARTDKIMQVLAGRYPRWYVRRIAAEMGLARAKEPDWSEKEVEYLHENYPCKGYIALRNGLKRINGGVSRSQTAVLVKAKRERINRRSDGLTMRMMEDLLGADHHKVEKWLRFGWLRAKRKGTERLESQGGDMWHFEPRKVREFVVEHPEEVDLRRVEKFHFIDLLAGRME